METAKTKAELLAELKAIEDKEMEEVENNRKRKNYENFKNRSSDYMIGRAHAELDYIGIKYSDGREKELLPCCVTITGNCGTSFRGTAQVTDATKTYFRNVWDNNYDRNEAVFQKKLNDLVHEEVNKICKQLPVVLEMMGLQSLRFFIKEENFEADKISEILDDVEFAQAEILSGYSDEDFLALIRPQTGWVTEDKEPVPEYLGVDLSHSRLILFRYIFKNRPALQDAFKACRFYSDFEDRILSAN